MRGTSFLLAGVLIFSTLAVLLGQTASVGAIGAATDNFTVPTFPIADQSQDEIKPPVNCVLQGPTSQAKSTPPNFVLGFIGAAEKDKFKITGNQSWYLDVDINAPGWLYIYEYFPAGKDFQGRWIAYKWQLAKSGLWRLGPFTAADNEPEGQHMYRVWFYSDGQWAIEDPNAPQSNLVYWTYLKGQPDEQALVVHANGDTCLERVGAFIMQPIVLVLSSVVLVIIIIFGLYIFYLRRYASRGKSKGRKLLPYEPEPGFSADVSLLAIARAKLALPEGVEIQLTGNNRIIGRGDLARTLELDALALISRRHFEVKSEDGQFYIEDLGSANGTVLNGVDISGQGPVYLNNDDIIEPAGVIPLKFCLPL